MHEHRASRGAAFGVAVGGVLAGHWLTYRLVSPHAHAREELVAGSGHGYLGLANDIGLALAMVGLAAVVLGRLIERADAPRRGRWFRWLAAFGVGAFVTMEVLERVSSGVPLSELLQHGLLPVGIAVQIGVAAVCALVVEWLPRAVDQARSVLATPLASPRLDLVRALTRAWHPPLRLLPSAGGIRGPPIVR